MTRLMTLFLWSTIAFAQAATSSITIPAQTVVVPVSINGTTQQLTIPIPAQTVALPATTLPAGFTWANNVLTIPGSISAVSVSLTGGSTLPTCASGLYLWQMTNGTLAPACYTAPTFTVPPLTISQAASPINTFTITP